MARLLLCSRRMIRPAPPASIGIAAALFAASATAAVAGPLNLLQPIPQSSTRIVIDASQPPWTSDDEATARLDGDCVAIADPRLRTSSGFGRVSWTRGRLAWEWDRGREPELVYVMCLDRARRQSSSGGGNSMSMVAALSSGHSQSAGTTTAIESSATPIPAPTSFEIGPTPFISWPVVVDPLDPSTPFGSAAEPTLLDFPVRTANADGGPHDVPLLVADAMEAFDPAARLLDPGDVAPVPEPSSWLLFGTGLAAACRSGRKK